MKMQPKNVHTDGGDTWIIGGKLVVEEGATVEGLEAGGSGLPEGGTNGQVLKIVADAPAWAADTNTTYTAMTAAQATTGTATTAQTISAKVLADAIVERPTPWDDINGKPVVIASGADQAAARAAIGAGTGNGTSNLTIGTTASTAAAGNHTHADMASASALADLASRVAALEAAVA